MIGARRECAYVRGQLWDYLALRLPTVAADRVQHHLRACAACRLEADSYRDLVRAVRADRAAPAAESAVSWPQLASLLETRGPVQLRASGPMAARVGWAAAVLALLAVAVLRFGRAGGPADAPLSTVSGRTRTAVAARHEQGSVRASALRGTDRVRLANVPNHGMPATVSSYVSRRHHWTAPRHPIVRLARTPEGSKPGRVIVSASLGAVDAAPKASSAPQSDTVAYVMDSAQPEPRSDYVLGTVGEDGRSGRAADIQSEDSAW